MSTPAQPAPSAPHRVYTGRATNWPMVAAALALTAPLLGFAVTAHPEGPAATSGTDLAVVTTFALGIALVTLLTATNVRTTAGPNGVTVHFGWIGYPRCTYRRAQIRQAEVVDVSPFTLLLGFWWTPWSTHCTLRSGPALRLHLATGRTVTVTVPDPDAAVTALGS